MLKRLKIKNQVYLLVVFSLFVVVFSTILNLVGISITGSLGDNLGWIIGFLVVIAVLSVLLLLFSNRIAGTISTSVQHINEFAFKVNKGDLTSRANMGVPVNCSALKKCDTKDCPCYGKESYCWVEAGSFSNYPSCPRALKGEDCRTCNLYKKSVTNEFEEMGSAINAVLDELSIKAGVTRKISRGDFDQEVHVVSNVDNLGHSLKDMVDQLNVVFNRFKQFVDQIAESSRQVSDSNQSISEGVSRQASSIEEISSSLDLINSQVDKNANQIDSANQLAKQTESAAKEGDGQIDLMLTSMNGINESSEKIVKIIKTIDEIAFQTNLLALNAAVEAARAGKYGKGFAVVAEEVRNLAGRSAKAAKETTELIENSNAKVKSGTQIAADTATVLKEILKSVAEFSRIMNEVAASSSSQTQGLAEINKGLEQIEQVIQQNAAFTEENASSSQELSAQASQLQQMMRRFRTGET